MYVCYLWSSASTMRHPFSFVARLRSFRYAIYGIAVMLTSQHNAWLHAVATVVIVSLGTSFGLSAGEWCWLVLAVMAVWTAEALNTALELLADVASPAFHPLVKQAKDVAAGAVLISACGATVIGALILGPRLLTFCGLLK
jgi:diacylglycerol kinase